MSCPQVPLPWSLVSTISRIGPVLPDYKAFSGERRLWEAEPPVLYQARHFFTDEAASSQNTNMGRGPYGLWAYEQPHYVHPLFVSNLGFPIMHGLSLEQLQSALIQPGEYDDVFQTSQLGDCTPPGAVRRDALFVRSRSDALHLCRSILVAYRLNRVGSYHLVDLNRSLGLRCTAGAPWDSYDYSYQSGGADIRVVTPTLTVQDNWAEVRVQCERDVAISSPNALHLGVPLNGDLRGFPHYCDLNFTLTVSTDSSNEEDNWFLVQPFVARAKNAAGNLSGGVNTFLVESDMHVSMVTQPGSGYAQATEADVRGTQYGGNAPCILFPENVKGGSESTNPLLAGVRVMNVGRSHQDCFIHGCFSAFLYKQDIDVFDPTR